MVDRAAATLRLCDDDLLIGPPRPDSARWIVDVLGTEDNAPFFDAITAGNAEILTELRDQLAARLRETGLAVRIYDDASELLTAARSTWPKHAWPTSLAVEPSDEACKRCSVCNKLLPLSAFARRRASSDELMSSCKNCQHNYALTRGDRQRIARLLAGDPVKRYSVDGLPPPRLTLTRATIGEFSCGATSTSPRPFRPRMNAERRLLSSLRSRQERAPGARARGRKRRGRGLSPRRARTCASDHASVTGCGTREGCAHNTTKAGPPPRCLVCGRLTPRPLTRARAF